LKRPAIFLDRDGVINSDRIDFVKSWEEFEFLPFSLEALAALSKTRYWIVVVTNQSGVARGLLTETELQQIHTRMIDRVRASGGRIDAVYYCPHSPDAGCSCRKPAPELFFKAARESGLDLTSSWAIGDSRRDVEAASRAGVRAILLDRSLPDASASAHFPYRFLRATDLLDAVRLVSGHAGRRDSHDS
jgi:D-glycero-D-manno-heptose 1,7-bisphosphate phosphatase